MENLQTTWVVIAAAISGITLIWKFIGTVKDIKKSINEPITKIDEKVTDLKALVEKNDSLQNQSLQSLLRDRLLYNYEAYEKLGYASISEKDNWENMYQKYHALGKNGVMDGVHDKIMLLPEKPVKASAQKKKTLNE